MGSILVRCTRVHQCLGRSVPRAAYLQSARVTLPRSSSIKGNKVVRPAETRQVQPPLGTIHIEDSLRRLMWPARKGSVRQARKAAGRLGIQLSTIPRPMMKYCASMLLHRPETKAFECGHHSMTLRGPGFGEVAVRVLSTCLQPRSLPRAGNLCNRL